jgi:hypothetical protein
MATHEPVRAPDELSPAERETYYLPGEVAEMYGVTTRTIANWCDRGILKAITTPTGQRRILASSLKGGRAYDDKKAAFVERMARKRAGAAIPSGDKIAEVVRESRKTGESKATDASGGVTGEVKTRAKRR